MISQIADTTLDLWKSKRKTKTSPSGWVSGNCPCCVHNGETVDTRSRGGFIVSEDSAISYSCFNCHYTAIYRPGGHLTYKFRKLLSFLGADDNTIKRLVIDAIRIKELVSPEKIKHEEHEEIIFKKRELPQEARDINDLITYYKSDDVTQIPKEFANSINYLTNERRIDTSKYRFFWTPETQYNLNKRIIIPFTWKNEILGYTARTYDNTVKPKYYSNIESNYVFNIDKQLPKSKFVVVVEGPFDAMAIDGVAVLGGECNELQADIIDSLGREVIVVPDSDKSGSILVDKAIEYGWHVSFPIWQETCKDTSESVTKYGKLFTLKAILEGKQTSKLKIELMKRKLFN